MLFPETMFFFVPYNQQISCCMYNEREKKFPSICYSNYFTERNKITAKQIQCKRECEASVYSMFVFFCELESHYMGCYRCIDSILRASLSVPYRKSVSNESMILQSRGRLLYIRTLHSVQDD